MEMNLGNIITLALGVITFAFGYGILSQRVKTIECRLEELDAIRIEIRKISDTLQNLVGRIDVFMKMSQEIKK